MKVLVTGAAGFIGMQLCEKLLARGETVLGVDNLNSYYDPRLKLDRLARLTGHRSFEFDAVDVADGGRMGRLFAERGVDRVVHLAAQAGVRHSLRDPGSYVQSNLVGFANVLEGCRHGRIRHLVYASSSSVYGGNTKMPFAETDRVDKPVSLYAATKKAGELMAYSYSHLFRIPVTGLRFFTVYGPWGRPDMAYFLFTKAILEGKAIDVFNHGNMRRDFTYIDDIIEGISRVLDRAPTEEEGEGGCPHRVFNIGNHDPVPLLDFIACIEKSLGLKAKLNMLPMQPGDVPATFADVSALKAWVGFHPATSYREGVERFVRWYREYYRC
jgi:UDP-glucuronate 4-epimerase